jgi:hypothetical protein
VKAAGVFFVWENQGKSSGSFLKGRTKELLIVGPAVVGEGAL